MWIENISVTFASQMAAGLVLFHLLYQQHATPAVQAPSAALFRIHWLS